MIEVKTADQLRLMRTAGLVVAEGLEAMCDAAAVGVTTAEIDAIGREILAKHGATSSFLGYGAEYGTPFPAVACISVNDELVHGIPGDRVLDLFAGSGTTGAVASALGRDAVLVDDNPEAIRVMRERMPQAVVRTV